MIEEIKQNLIADVSSAFVIDVPIERFENCNKYAIKTGLVLEFGVYDGGTIHMIESVFKTTVYGFDSWEGLPEDSDDVPKGIEGSYHKGAFVSNKLIPKLNNIVLVDGWFKDTLPCFVEQHKEHCRFIHVDSDQYCSAKDIFNNLSDRIVDGTVICFDEFACHEGWEYREFRAFAEFLHDTNAGYQVIHRSNNNERVSFKIKRPL